MWSTSLTVCWCIIYLLRFISWHNLNSKFRRKTTIRYPAQYSTSKMSRSRATINLKMFFFFLRLKIAAFNNNNNNNLSFVHCEATTKSSIEEGENINERLNWFSNVKIEKWTMYERKKFQSSKWSISSAGTFYCPLLATRCSLLVSNFNHMNEFTLWHIEWKIHTFETSWTIPFNLVRCNTFNSLIFRLANMVNT